jgi:methyltransferase-like protein
MLGTSVTTGAPSSYDAVPYDDRVFYRTHPDVLATVATLHGLEPPPIERCRVLELGCAVGGNLIPMALGLPDARFVGVDLSPGQIATGREVIGRLGLRNVELLAMSITDVGAALGEFDYVVCHGVYSWVPPAVQDAILAVCGSRLAPNGVAYVSYNTYPGWHLRGLARELMQHHARRYDDPGERVKEARAFLDLVLAVQRARHPGSAYGAVLEEEARLLEDAPDDYVFHEHLEDQNAPLYFREFVARAAEHGLVYLDDARPRDAGEGLTDEVRHALDALASTPLEREQYLDWLGNRTFRRSLLCRAERAPDPARRPERLARLHVTARLRATSSSPDLRPGIVERFEAADSKVTMSTDDAGLKATFVRLAHAWPGGVAFETLACEAADGERFAAALLRCYLAGLVELHTRVAPCATVAGERPVASPLARLQAERQARVTNLLHRAVVLEDADRLLLGLLDGTRDRRMLVDTLATTVVDGRFRIERDGATLDDPPAVRGLFADWLDPALRRLASAALLVA